MKIDIWSDVRCPFCYIGKHKFEKALANFPHKEKIEIEWHSFELDPYLKTDTTSSSYEHLAKAKKMTVEDTKEMSQNVIDYAEELDIHFNFDKVVVANSFNAHKLIQFAKTKGKGNEAEESLFKAYFTEGKNIDSDEVLVEIGKTLGMEVIDVKAMLTNHDSDYEVIRDEQDAGKLGIRGVPFFVFNDKYAVSGAQQPGVFAQVLDRSWKEFSETQKPLIIQEGDSCTVDGNCD